MLNVFINMLHSRHNARRYFNYVFCAVASVSAVVYTQLADGPRLFTYWLMWTDFVTFSRLLCWNQTSWFFSVF